MRMRMVTWQTTTIRRPPDFRALAEGQATPANRGDTTMTSIITSSSPRTTRTRVSLKCRRPTAQANKKWPACIRNKSTIALQAVAVISSTRPRIVSSKKLWRSSWLHHNLQIIHPQVIVITTLPRRVKIATNIATIWLSAKMAQSELEWTQTSRTTPSWFSHQVRPIQASVALQRIKMRSICPSNRLQQACKREERRSFRTRIAAKSNISALVAALPSTQGARRQLHQDLNIKILLLWSQGSCSRRKLLMIGCLRPLRRWELHSQLHIRDLLSPPMPNSKRKRLWENLRWRRGCEPLAEHPTSIQ